MLSEGGERYALSHVPVQHAGALALFAPPAAASGTGYLSARSWDLTDGDARVELAQVSAVGARSVFALVLDPQHWWRFEIADGVLRCQDQQEAGRSQTESSYDVHAHRYLRIAHHAAQSTLTWEVSPDGADWTVLRTRSASWSVRGLRAELALYADEPGAQGSTVFQHFSLHSGIFDP